MKRAVLIFLIVLANLTWAQVTVDSLNVTPSTFQKRTSANYSFTQNDTVSLNILNSIGQTILNIKTDVILNSGFYQDSIIMDAFPDGMYFVHLKLGKRKTIVKKIIKTAFAGVNELGLFTEAKIYPNPVSSILNIKIEKHVGSGTEIEIANVFGQIVLKLSYLNEIDISLLAPGYYTLKIIDSNKQQFHSKFSKE